MKDFLPLARLDSSLAPPRGWAMPPRRASLLLRCDSPDRPTVLSGGSETISQWPDPLAALRWMDATRSPDRRAGRWVGFLSYDLGRLFEALPARAADDLHLPLFAFGFYPAEPSTEPLSRERSERFSSAKPTSPRSTLPRASYLTACSKVIDYIRAGDIFQANLAQRLTVNLLTDPHDIYARLPPAAHGAFLDFGDFALISNSPELFLRVENRRVTTRPIKGTRPNAPGMFDELLNSEKDAAELNMIVDLERNDLGRVCEVGSVRVTSPRQIETHPTVLHGVATVEGTLRPGVGFVDLLAATFPGGSITGAPKIRAMQIIDELEPVRRGPYCGAIGYLDADGSCQFNVAIRTIVATGGLAHVGVGGGIVADSDPLAEYAETWTKARAMLDALGCPLP